MTQLNQIVAIENGVEKTSEAELTEAYHLIQRDALFGGITRTYQPNDDEGDQLPPESVKVQANVENILRNIAIASGRFYDVRLTKETANTKAVADLKVDGVVIASDVPVTFLIQLENILVHLQTFVSKLPVLDQAEEWHPDSATGLYVTENAETTRSKKVPRRFIKYDATDKHPAQVDVWQEDIIVGRWTTRKSSGRLSPVRKAELLARVKKLIEAIKLAREEANRLVVTDRKIGDALFGYLLDGGI